MNDFDRMISIDPEYSMTYYLKGKLLSSMSEIEQSIEQYDLAIEFNPKFVDAYYEKGKMLLDLGKPNEAIEEFSNGLNLSGNNCYNGLKLREHAYRILGEHEIADSDKENAEKILNKKD